MSIQDLLNKSEPPATPSPSRTISTNRISHKHSISILSPKGISIRRGSPGKQSKIFEILQTHHGLPGQHYFNSEVDKDWEDTDGEGHLSDDKGSGIEYGSGNGRFQHFIMLM